MQKILKEIQQLRKKFESNWNSNNKSFIYLDTDIDILVDIIEQLAIKINKLEVDINKLK